MNRRGFLKASATLAAVALAPVVTAETVTGLIDRIDDDYARFIALVYKGEPILNDEFTFRRAVDVDVSCYIQDCKFYLRDDGELVFTGESVRFYHSYIENHNPNRTNSMRLHGCKSGRFVGVHFNDKAPKPFKSPYNEFKSEYHSYFYTTPDKSPRFIQCQFGG